MAKRVPQEEKPYRPVSEELVRSVVGHNVQELSEERAVDAVGEGRSAAAHAPRAAERPAPPRVVALPPKEKTAEAPARSEKLNREKRVLLTPEEERTVEGLVHEMAGKLGTTLKLSHVIRASLALLVHVEEELLKRCEQAGPMVRPPNGNPVALAEFEDEVGKLLYHAFRNGPPRR